MAISVSAEQDMSTDITFEDIFKPTFAYMKELKSQDLGNVPYCKKLKEYLDANAIQHPTDDSKIIDKLKAEIAVIN